MSPAAAAGGEGKRPAPEAVAQVRLTAAELALVAGLVADAVDAEENHLRDLAVATTDERGPLTPSASDTRRLDALRGALAAREESGA